MNPILYTLPFISLLLVAIGGALQSSFATMPWIAYTTWGVAFSFLAVWIYLERTAIQESFKRKGAKYGASSGIVVLVTLLVMIGLAVVTSRPRFNKSIDLTRNKENTLDEQSIKIIEDMKKRSAKVQATAFVAEDQVRKDVTDLVQLYTSKGADIQLEFVNPTVERSRAVEENVTAMNTVILRSGERNIHVTTLNEEKFSNGLVSILKDGSKSIYFITGHGEGSIQNTNQGGYKLVSERLTNNKYKVEELSLLEKASIPEDADLLVIAGPNYDFAAEETRILEEYLRKGGALFTLVRGATYLPNLSKMLEKFGVKPADDFLVIPDNDARRLFFGNRNVIVSEFDKTHQISKDFTNNSKIFGLMPDARSIETLETNAMEMKAIVVAKTNNGMWRITNVKDENSLKGGIARDRISNGEFPILVAAEGASKASPVADNQKTEGDTKTDSENKSEAGSTKSKEIRLVVAGSNFGVNELSQENAINSDLFINTASYLMKDQEFISLKPKDQNASELSLTSGMSSLMLFVLCFVYPFLFLFGGVGYWLVRRRA